MNALEPKQSVEEARQSAEEKRWELAAWADAERAKKRLQQSRSSGALTIPARPRYSGHHIVDVDDVSLDQDSLWVNKARERSWPWDSAGARESARTNPSSQPGRAYSPKACRAQRAGTEELAAPPADAWAKIEIAALLEGLQRFRGPDRYYQIADAFTHWLSFRDIDDMMRQAKFLQQSLAGYNPEGHDWSFLTSV